MGGPLPDAGTKAVPSTIREFEATLRDVGFSHAQARDIAARASPSRRLGTSRADRRAPPKRKFRAQRFAGRDRRLQALIQDIRP